LTSDVSARAHALVVERLPQARGLGQTLADLIEYPEEFVEALRDGLPQLADEAYANEQERVAPGSLVFGVRTPLLAAVIHQLHAPLRETSPALALSLAERLATEDEREFVFFAHLALECVLPTDPERGWQLMRRLGRRARDWIKVDALADLYARGILAEPVRWAEVEQLVFSTSEWERRLVGSTIATIPFRLVPSHRHELARSPALGLVRSLIGDDSEAVRKSLSWALRSWRKVDGPGVNDLLRDEARRAAATDDGNRAWVIRDALREARVPAPAPLIAELRATLAGVRRRSGGGSTSEAGEISSRFVGLERLSDKAIVQQGERQRYYARQYGAGKP
jgi:3-methyladenine DNA glycosylase AlkD